MGGWVSGDEGLGAGPLAHGFGGSVPGAALQVGPDSLGIGEGFTTEATLSHDDHSLITNKKDQGTVSAYQSYN